MRIPPSDYLLASTLLALLLLPAPARIAPAQAVGSEDSGTPSAQVLAIDVSHHSGEIDWQSVEAAGYQLAYIKATEGVDAADPRFDQNWRAAGQAGLLRGAYHFYVTEDDPTEQADFFLEALGTIAGDELVPAVDVEVIGRGTQPGLADRLRTFLDRVEQATGVKPLIYTSPNFWDAHLDDSFGEYPLWVAEYGVDSPRLPSGWDRWHLWQWKKNQQVNGIEKDVDLNRLRPDLEAHHLQIRHRRTADESRPESRR